MAGIARLNDSISCGDVLAGGSGNVFVNGMPIGRVGDLTAGHCFPPVAITAGAGTVFANNKPVASAGSPTAPHCCTCDGDTHSGTVIGGSPDVLVE